MTSEFGLALERIISGENVTQRDWQALSSPSRQDRDLFVARLRSEGDESRRSILERLVRAADEDFALDFAALLKPFLDDADAIVRRLAIEGLWEYERPDLARVLLHLLANDPDVTVRAAAALSLGRFVFLAECEELQSDLARLVTTGLRAAAESPVEDIEVRRRAIEGLAYINGEAWVRRLIELAYYDENPRMRQSALLAMGRNAEMVWAKPVLAELQSQDPTMRHEAARASGEMRLGRAVESLIALVADVDPQVQQMAIWALGQIGGERAREILEACAQEADEEIAKAAAEALDELEFTAWGRELLGIDSPGVAEEEDQDALEDDYRWDAQDPLTLD